MAPPLLLLLLAVLPAVDSLWTSCAPLRAPHRSPVRSRRLVVQASMFQEMEAQLSDALGDVVQISSGASPGAAGGGGAAVGSLVDSVSGRKFFYKATGLHGFDMLRAEFLGVKEMAETGTITVPNPIVLGTSANNAFAVFDYLEMGHPKTNEVSATMGRELAAMHRATSENGLYGWRVNNTCGATLQPNTWTQEWPDFWDSQRLGHMLRLCKRDGAVFPNEQELRTKVRAMLEDHVRTNAVQPSLVHGDLWTGNAGATKDGRPCIFDPATYYGDREVDYAMTTLFGRFSNSFYESYQEEWPLPDGWEERRTIYNLYHILNHYVLFGGGYLSQAQSMIGKILAF